MRAIPIAIVAMLLVSSSAWADCTQQAATIFYANGVDALKDDAEASKERLKEEVAPELTAEQADCVTFRVSYNTNEPLFLDFLEAGLQKAQEEVGSLEAFWESYFRSFTARNFPAFDLLARALFGTVNIAIQAELYVLGNQVALHLGEYDAAFALGHRVILFGHSQGNLYVKEEYARLTTAQKAQTRAIAVSTPSDSVPGNGPYTTLFKDSLAAAFFAPLGALPANTPMDEECQDVFLEIFVAPWFCHGFKEAYMFGTEPREKIVAHVRAALPEPDAITPHLACGTPPQGVVGTPYSHFFPVTGGTSPYTFSISDGNLPAGLSLDEDSGAVTGTPTSAGVSPFTVRVTDNSYGPYPPAINHCTWVDGAETYIGIDAEDTFDVAEGTFRSFFYQHFINGVPLGPGSGTFDYRFGIRSPNGCTPPANHLINGSWVYGAYGIVGGELNPPGSGVIRVDFFGLDIASMPRSFYWAFNNGSVVPATETSVVSSVACSITIFLGNDGCPCPQ